jgi:hypothetical protein
MWHDADKDPNGERYRKAQICSEAGHDLCVLSDAWYDGCLGGGAACFEIKALQNLKCLRFANIELQVCRLRKFEGLNVWVSEHTPNLSF